MKPFLYLLCLADPSCLWSQPVPNTPFSLTGVIESFTLDAPTPLSSAKIRVHGINVQIPANLIVQMPGTYMTPADLFREPQIIAPTATSGRIVDLSKTVFRAFSCLSLADINDPAKACSIRGSIEATVIGNIIGGNYIADLVWISHNALAEASGVVDSVSSNPPELTVHSHAGDLVRVRINDPEGRFSIAHSDDVRFKSDDENPTIHAESGYPMCISRGALDPLCPGANRPAANPNRFTIGAIRQSADYPACPACDPRVAAPIIAGDQIVYSGTLMADAAGTFISAHTIEVNVAIYTAPCSSNCTGVPVYVFIEGSRAGTGGVPFPNLSQDVIGRNLPPPAIATHVKVEGMTTDPTRPVRVFAVDVEPTTGDESRRLLATIPAAAAPFGRFRLVLPPANHLPAAREILAVPAGVNEATGISSTVVGRVLVSGLYQAPVGEFVFAESNLPGQRPIPMNFESLCFLLDGSGPLATRPWSGAPPASIPTVGRLAPFPFSGQTAKDLDAFGNALCRTPLP